MPVLVPIIDAPRPHTMTYRPDIDGLRAIAVSAVILFHYFGNLVPSGYLGVDVFFVISGYVITSYLFGAPKVSLSDFLLTFYTRRVKRLVPALTICVIVTAILFVLVTTRPPPEAFASGAWALIGFSNVQLLRSSQDYFALDAQLNPFTHTWSLGLEEQFYFVFPALIALTGYSWTNKQHTEARAAVMVGILSLASLSTYLVFQQIRPNAAFYLMPPRFWEFGVGCLVYLATAFWPAPGQQRLANLCAAGLVACFMLPNAWPSAATLLAVATTAALIFTRGYGSITYMVLTFRSSVFVGRISYSLYLWHWSMLVLGKWTLGDNLVVLSVLLVVTTVTAIATYTLVEEPLRRAKWSSSKVLTLAMGAVVVAPLVIVVRDYIPRYTQGDNNNLPGLLGVLPPETWTANPCHGREALSKLADPMVFCLAADRSSQKPNVLYLLGDSHATQLFLMTKLATEGLPFASRSINLGEEREFVVGFVGSVRQSRLLDYVLATAKPGDAIAIAFHRGLLNPARDKHVKLGSAQPLNELSNHFVAAMEAYVVKFVKRGIRIIFVGDTPLMGAVATSSTCALQIKLFGSSICRVSKAQDLQTRSQQDQVFTKLAAGRSNDVLIWDTSQEFYANAEYIDVLDESGRYIMMDWNHITEERAAKLAPGFRRFLRQNILR